MIPDLPVPFWSQGYLAAQPARPGATWGVGESRICIRALGILAVLLGGVGQADLMGFACVKTTLASAGDRIGGSFLSRYGASS